jgi:hypothetical protein
MKIEMELGKLRDALVNAKAMPELIAHHQKELESGFRHASLVTPAEKTPPNRVVKGPQLPLPKMEQISTRTKRREPEGSEPELSKVERLMLIALAQHPVGLSRKQVLIFTGYRHSGQTSSAFARLLAAAYVEARAGLLYITAWGLTALGPYESLPIGDELRAQLLNGSNDLLAVEKVILRRASEVYPAVIDRTTARGDYAHSGQTSSAFARLIAMNYLTKAPGGVRAAEELFG